MRKYITAALLVLTTKALLAQTDTLTMQDTRSIPSTPDSYRGSLQGHFKAATALGLSTSYYYTVLGLRGWVDDSGGKAHEFAFGDDNKVFLRSGLNNTGWGGWRSLLVSNEDGNFGIGLSNFPTEKLTVNGNIKLADRASGYLIDYASLSETNSGASTILGNNVVAGTITNSVKKTRSIYDPGSFVSLNYYHGITFHTGVNGELNLDQPVENSEKMRITQNGNVGIGTTNPQAMLDVNGAAIVSGPAGVTLTLKKSANNIPAMAFQGANQVVVIEGGDDYLTAYLGGARRFSILSNGNLGIGTNNPLSKLDVNGNINMPDGYNLTWGGNYGPDIPTIASSINAGINFYPSGSTLGSAVHINRNGNLVVGKTTQSNSSYKLDVNGKARVSEIVVNTTGADFVFDEDYKLRSLSEVEAFIKEYKHLPEIPTAKQMVNNGVNLGELNIKLLQKVEELTLHLIEKDKELQKEASLIKGQQDEIQGLKKGYVELKQQLELFMKQKNNEYEKNNTTNR